MAVLNKLRNSTWVLIVVLVSLGLFVASDYFSSSNKYNFGGSDQNVGEIDGKKISLTDFDERYKNLLAQIASNGSGETEENKEQASILKAPVNTPSLMFTLTAFDIRGRTMEHCVSIKRGDKYDFKFSIQA